MKVAKLCSEAGIDLGWDSHQRTEGEDFALKDFSLKMMKCCAKQ